jgi:multiple sugar transport system permease protein
MRRTLSQECALLAAFVLVVIGIFYAVPLIQIIYGSLRSSPGLSADDTGHFVWFSNYARAIDAEGLGQSLLATVAFTVPSVIIQVGFAFAAALLTSRNYAGVRLVRAILIAPYFLPTVVVVFAWKFFADPFVGVLPAIFSWGGMSPLDLQGPTAALPVMILVATYEAFPFAYVILLARMMRIPIVLYEVAELDGAGPVRKFFAVTWPQIRLTLAGVFILRALITWLKFDVPWLVYAVKAQSPWADTLAVRIYRVAFLNLQRGDAYALSFLMLLAAWAAYGYWMLISGGRAGARGRIA